MLASILAWIPVFISPTGQDIVFYSLKHPKPSVRIAAIETLANQHSPFAISPLIHALAKAKSNSSTANAAAPRAHFLSGTKKAYVGDFDVEIATAATIAKPKVFHAFDGSILDVRILGVHREIVLRYERTKIRKALTKLTGQDYGENAAAWSAWWQKHPSFPYFQPKTTLRSGKN